ncbi:hypothetical protein [Rhodococcus rhodochrous]|uniref:hypothetical protein n=1 Tax=Rhodococcus rhodochrous TaxID=1829 RepID=UPI001E5F2769|nr:hypothetical protein [Rhodococcus rhodochrous]MCB8914200.1 hypothetical protein [Rhodococcus rhodochrous]MDJ0400883.1 hypothetical protein [Rhodococcus rhodochrous]
MTEYHVCSSCSVVLVNADDSGVDPDDLNVVTATIEAMGLVAHAGTYDHWGYWTCEVCGWDQLGESNVFESVA